MVHDTFDTLLTQTCEKYGDHDAIRYRDRSVTYGELLERSNALAAALFDLGMGRDDRTALMLANRPAYVVANLAVPRAGGVWVPLNDMLGASDLRYMLSDSRARFAIAGPTFADVLAEIAPELPLLEHVILVGDADLDTTDLTVHRYEEVLAEYNGPPPVENAPGDVVAQYYTGGTTGRPKGVVHSHENFVLVLYSHVIELDIADEQMLLTTPLPHSAGLFALAGFLRGSTAFVKREFDPGETLRTIEAEGITWTFMVPTMIYRVLDHPALESSDLSSLETLTYGAAPMTKERIAEGLDAFGPVFQQFYGQTEIPNLITTLTKSDHVSALERDNDEVLSSAGQPVVMADVKIVDVESGEEVERGEDGEILATAPYALERYYNRPAKNAETFEGEWIRTGDIGRIDERGFVYLLDRDSDLIISGGMNVYSTEVEDVINAHEGIAQSAVIGIPDDEWGEAVHAVVVPYDADALSTDDLLAFCRSRLADYKRPKSVEFVDSLPETPYGKIDKKALREPHWTDQSRQIH